MTLVLVSIGGALGALVRYRLGVAIVRKEKATFPLGTFLINISGALALGVLCGFGVTGNPYFLLGDGFCGAFTTFSTFSVESVQLIRSKAPKKAALFIVLSMAVGYICFAVGYFMGKFLSSF